MPNFKFPSGEKSSVKPEHFDTYWQLANILMHYREKNARGLRFISGGYRVDSKLLFKKDTAFHDALSSHTHYPRLLDFLIVSPHQPLNHSWLCQQKSSQASWSTLPRGLLSVDRLLANKPCFTTPHPRPQEKKQSLLFHDWSALGWGINKTTQVTRLADELLQDGYSLYVLHEHEALKVASGQMLVDGLKKNNRPCSDDALVLAASKKNTERPAAYHRLSRIKHPD